MLRLPNTYPSKPMAKQRSFDTSKYISLPVALLAVVAVLIILVLVGMKYSAFRGDLLSASVAQSTDLRRCVREHNQCITDATGEYHKCTNTAERTLRRCLEGITDRDPILREARRADCELQSARDVGACTLRLSQDILGCQAVMQECLQKAHDKKGIEPHPGPQEEAVGE